MTPEDYSVLVYLRGIPTCTTCKFYVDKRNGYCTRVPEFVNPMTGEITDRLAVKHCRMSNEMCGLKGSWYQLDDQPDIERVE